MAWIHVRHTVEDYVKWKAVYDSIADYKRSLGWKGYQLFSVNGNQNDVLVMEEFGSAQEAQAFLASPGLREAMGKAGVTGHPDIAVVEDMESGRA